jgi:hypothetical protein
VRYENQLPRDRWPVPLLDRGSSRCFVPVGDMPQLADKGLEGRKVISCVKSMSGDVRIESLDFYVDGRHVLVSDIDQEASAAPGKLMLFNDPEGPCTGRVRFDLFHIRHRGMLNNLTQNKANFLKSETLAVASGFHAPFDKSGNYRTALESIEEFYANNTHKAEEWEKYYPAIDRDNNDGFHSEGFGTDEHSEDCFRNTRDNLFLLAGMGTLAKRNRFLQLTAVAREVLPKYSTIAFILQNVNFVEDWIDNMALLFPSLKSDYEQDQVPDLEEADDDEEEERQPGPEEEEEEGEEEEEEEEEEEDDMPGLVECDKLPAASAANGSVAGDVEELHAAGE